MVEHLPRQRDVYRRSPGSAPHRLVRRVEDLSSSLPPTSILIRVHAISVNFRDPNMLNGTNPFYVMDEGIPCSDAAGEVIALGTHTARFHIGDRVCPILDTKAITGEEQDRQWLGSDVDGVLATHLVCDEQLCVRVPDHLSWAEAACLPNAGVTAWSAIVTEGRTLVTGQTILFQGTGGVSTMGLKLALAAGCRAIVTSSSDEKLSQIKTMAGGDRIQTINYKTNIKWDEEVHRLNGTGVDIVVEIGGTPSTLMSLRAVKKGGIISQVGYLGNQDPTDLEGLISLLIDKAVNFRGINVGSRLDFERMNRAIAASGLHIEDLIDRKFSFDEAPEALDYLWQGKHVGKVVIEVP